MDEKLKKTIETFINVCNNNIADSDLNYIDITGCSPLGWAAVLGKYDYVNDLIKRGSNPNIRIFAFLFQMVKISWILEPALSAVTILLPKHLKNILNKQKILNGFKILKEHGYMNDDGIQIKYIVNILYEVNKYNCFSKSMIERWKTQEEFNKKVRLSFWFFPKIVDKNNYYIHKFYKSNVISHRIRSELLALYNNNPSGSYKLVSELIPINKYEIDTFLNDKWINVILPDIVQGMMIRVICEDKN